MDENLRILNRLSTDPTTFMLPMPFGTETPPPDETDDDGDEDSVDLGVAAPIGDVDACDSETETFGLDCIDDRERALPVRQGDLTRLLLAEPGVSEVDREKLSEFGRLLAAAFHSKFFTTLRELKETYAPLDPDADYVQIEGHSRTLQESSFDAFMKPFESALERANYNTLSREILEQAIMAPNELGLTYVPDFSLFDHMTVYVRGFTQIAREIRSVKTRFKKRTVLLDAYARMVVALKFKPGFDLGPLVRSDVLYLRMFKDVPHVDMEMHLPEQGTRVRMRIFDKAMIASPVATGLPAILSKLLSVAIIPKMLLIPLIIAPVSAGVKSYFGFRQAKQKHLLTMIHRLYYLTLANNASVITRMVDSAEDEEYKEAMLAYYFLHLGAPDGTPWTVSRLDRHIETFLRDRTQVTINFEVADALSKLFRVGLAHRDTQGILEATPIDQALQILGKWDDTEFYS